MDFLGLRNLDVIEDAIDIIERSRGERVDMEQIPIDDAKTYAMLAGGDSTGVFQFESEGMRDALRKVRPTEFADIVALGALYRPGAMAYIPAYAKGKKDPSTVRYPDPRLKAITEETHGCVVYQEQLMQIARTMAGFSGAEADDLRKAIGKKKRDLMATMKDKFMDGLAKSEHRPERRRRPLEAERSRRRLLVQQVPRCLLRADLLPHRLPQGQLPGRVHGGGDLLGDEHQRQGPVLRQPLRGNGDRRPAARRQLLRPQLRRLREGDPLRPRRGQERRLRGGRGDPPRPRGETDRVDLGLLRAGRLARGQQTGDRMPDQVRRPRLDRRQPQRDAGNAAGGAVGRAEGAGGRADGPGLDLRLRRRGRRGRGRPVAGPPPAADPRRRVRPRRDAGDGEGDARHLPLLAPAAGSGAGAAGAGRLQPRAAGEQA